MGNDDQLGFFLLNLAHDCVDTAANNWWSLGWLVWLALGSQRRSLLKTRLAVFLGLWSVLVKQFEQLTCLKWTKNREKTFK
jgi:hypothetical protein